MKRIKREARSGGLQRTLFARFFLLSATLGFVSPAFGIVGGAALAPGHPGHASAVGLALGVPSRGRVSASICSGTLIRADVVVTAAHCLANASVRGVVFGENMFAPGAQAQPVAGVAFHPEYFKDGHGRNFDIGLVRFRGPLPAGSAPIRILGDRAVLKPRLPLELVGYGDDITLIGRAGRKLGTSSFLSGFVDNALYRGQAIGARTQSLEVFLRSMMVVGPNAGHGACQGDSGGPAYARIGTEWMLLGALKGTMDDRCEAGRAMYTFVGDYLPWIQGMLSRWH